MDDTAGKYAFAFNSMWRSSDKATLGEFTLDDSQGVRDVAISALDLDNITSGQGAVVLDARERRILLQTSTPNAPQRLCYRKLIEDAGEYNYSRFPAQRPSHIHFKCGRDMGYLASRHSCFSPWTS